MLYSCAHAKLQISSVFMEHSVVNFCGSKSKLFFIHVCKKLKTYLHYPDTVSIANGTDSINMLQSILVMYDIIICYITSHLI